MLALTIFVAYAPISNTSSYDEEEIEASYMGLEKFRKEDHTSYRVIISETPRSALEERLKNFTSVPTAHSEANLPSMDVESRGGECHNEIEHIIVNRRFCLTDVGVVPKFYTKSDHCLVRAKFFFSRRGEKAAKFKKWSSKPVINWGLFTSLAGFWEDAVVDNIDEEYDWLVQHLRDSAKKAEGSRGTKRRLSYEALELIRQRGAARAATNS